MDISFVIPVYNEKKNCPLLHQKIIAAMSKLDKTYEIIFVDDGSQDNTFEILQQLHPVKIIKFRKNFGQTAAMQAGIDHAKGNVIITMDGDLQNDPQDVAKLLEKLNQGYDVVSGWRYNRKDSFSKKIFSRGADKLRKFLIDDHIHDSGCSLKAYRKECFEQVRLMGEMHRFIPALLRLEGFKVGEVKVSHHPRKFGKTKYGVKRLLKGFLDLINLWFWRKYNARPMHIFGSLGITFLILGFISGAYAGYLKLFQNIDLSNTFLPTISVMMIILGVQFFASGIIADIVIKNNYSITNKKSYSIKTIIDTTKKP